jgi:hypothetical protein
MEKGEECGTDNLHKENPNLVFPPFAESFSGSTLFFSLFMEYHKTMALASAITRKF